MHQVNETYSVDPFYPLSGMEQQRQGLTDIYSAK